MQYEEDEAIEYGDRQAVLTWHFRFWIRKNKANGINQHIYKEDGVLRTWTFNKIDAFEKIFRYWTKKMIRNLLDSLLERKVIIKGNFNKNPHDRTCWYAFLDEAKFLREVPQRQQDPHLPSGANGNAESGKSSCLDGQMEMPNRANGNAESGKCNIETDTIPNKDTQIFSFLDPKTASKNDLENYGKEKKYLSDFEDFWIKNEAKGWKGIENRYAQYDGWELEYKKKYPEKHKKTLNSESTVAQSDPIKINNNDPLWLKLSEVLKSDFEKDVYEKWLSKLNFIHLKDGDMLLGTESKFLRDWIKREHLTKIKSSFQQAEESLKSINIIQINS
jgi:hypothetical protein